MTKRRKGPVQRAASARRATVERPAAGLDFGPLQHQLGYLLRRAQIGVFRDFFAAFSAFDMRPAQYSVLTIIEQNPGSSQGRVSDALGIQRANFVAMLDELEARGFVRRSAAPNDRRSYALFLTAKGQEFLPKLHRTAAQLEQGIITRMGLDNHRRIFNMLTSLLAGDDDGPAALPRAVPSGGRRSRAGTIKAGATRRARLTAL